MIRLPDDVLLDVFDFYVKTEREIEAWQLLVHVCQRWRIIVFGSPRRLNLRLVCTLKTPAKDTLDVWPALPLIINYGGPILEPSNDNVIAALGQSNRVCEVRLGHLKIWQIRKVVAAMQVPFPELTHLLLSQIGAGTLVIPDSFLGGFAPSLQNFQLSRISFPGLPKFILSATHLVTLWLDSIPHSGYISPESMVALISVLSGLKNLILGFQSPQSRPHRKTRSLPPMKRSILPALSYLKFKGVTEYLEELVTCISTPQLRAVYITFYNQIDFDCRRLDQFINRTPKYRALDEAYVQFYEYIAVVKFRDRNSPFTPGGLEIEISCEEPDWQLSSIEQVCNSALYILSTVEDLYIERRYRESVWKDDAIENTLWLQLLLPFTVVKNLYLSNEFALGITATLQELVGGTTEVLPSLQNIFLEGLEPSGPVRENIERFVATRQLSGHPIAFSDWDKDLDSE